MNAVSDPTEEERKGGSGNIGKMVFTVFEDKSKKDQSPKFATVQYVPKDLGSECNAKEWLKAALEICLPDGQKAYLDEIKTCEGCPEENWAQFYLDGTPKDQENGLFALKLRDPMISNAYNFLRKKNLFPEDDDEN